MSSSAIAFYLVHTQNESKEKNKCQQTNKQPKSDFIEFGNAQLNDMQYAWSRLS